MLKHKTGLPELIAFGLLLRFLYSVSGSSLTNVPPDLNVAVPLTRQSLVKLLSTWMSAKTVKMRVQEKRDGGDAMVLHSPSSEPPEGWLQPQKHCSFTEVIQNHFQHYISLPVTIVSNLRGSTEVCDNLQVEKVSMELEQHHEITPSWLKDATLAGECPWKLVKRKMDDNMVPPEVLEVNCLCDGFQCLEGGNFECTPVAREVIMWRSDLQHSYLLSPDRVRVTVGCLCAQRRSPEAGTIDHLQSD